MAANPFDFDVTKMMADFRFRPFDVEAVMACQRRNIEALAQANQLTIEAVQAVARRQIEIARQSLEEMSALLRDLTQPATTEDRIAKNTEYAKQILEKSVSNGREITLLATKAGVEGSLRFKIHTPLIQLTKAQIIQRGTELGVDYGLTHSCYDPTPAGVPCGHCDACLIRQKGFADAGLGSIFTSIMPCAGLPSGANSSTVLVILRSR